MSEAAPAILTLTERGITIEFGPLTELPSAWHATLFDAVTRAVKELKPDIQIYDDTGAAIPPHDCRENYTSMGQCVVCRNNPFRYERATRE